MTYHDSKELSELIAGLSQILQSAAVRYAAESKLNKVMNVSDLDQMPLSMAEVSEEMLRFGANAWPDTIAPSPFEVEAEANAGSWSYRPLMGILASVLLVTPLAAEVACYVWRFSDVAK
jgi:hypothetical protein